MTNIKFKKNRLESIDLLRGIVALTVALFYSTHNTGFLNPEDIEHNLFKYVGVIGVAVFFIISGYILPYSMHKANYKAFL